jgi:hypothetical protein
VSRAEKTEAQLLAKLSELAAKEREHERERLDTLQAWKESRAVQIRADAEVKLGDCPALHDGEFEAIARREQLLRDHARAEPDHQRALRQIADLNAEEARRLGNAAA